MTVTTPASTTGPAQTRHHHYERPGISPVVFARHLIDHVAFLEVEWQIRQVVPGKVLAEDGK